MAQRRPIQLAGLLPLAAAAVILACGGDSPLDVVPTATTAATTVSTPPTQVVAPTFTQAPATATPQPSGEQQYTVQAGDTLSGIAGQFGVTVDAIIQANSITDPNAIFPGETLIIPAAP